MSVETLTKFYLSSVDQKDPQYYHFQKPLKLFKEL